MMKKTLHLLALIAIVFFVACSNSDSNDEGINDCNAAIQNTVEAQANLSGANLTNYTSLCENYSAALQTQIDLCGDEDGVLQAAIDALGNCTQSGANALMTANLDGVQYNNMKPNGFNTFQRAVSVVTFSYANDYDYIKIQGNSTYAQVIPDNTTKEINLFIPENAWQEGTYTLETFPVYNTDGNVVLPHFDVNFFYGNNIQGYTSDYGGTLIITEFDTVNRVIIGTFEFQYITSNLQTGEDTGPLDCINGTFNYSLDDQYFD